MRWLLRGGLLYDGEPLPWRTVAWPREYGHHVALNRDNRPWSAIAWGTALGVDRTSARGRVRNRVPGDESTTTG
jgi:hypothetical protein